MGKAGRRRWRIKGTHTLRESVAKRVFQFASQVVRGVGGECEVGNQARRHLMVHDTLTGGGSAQ